MDKGFSGLIGIFKGQQHFPGTRGAFGYGPEYDILIRENLRVSLVLEKKQRRGSFDVHACRPYAFGQSLCAISNLLPTLKSDGRFAEGNHLS